MNPIFGQSNIDISNKLYGGKDSIITMLISNQIFDFSSIADFYIEDNNLISNISNIGYNYATGGKTSSKKYVTQSGNFYITQSGNNYITE